MDSVAEIVDTVTPSQSASGVNVVVTDTASAVSAQSTSRSKLLVIPGFNYQSKCFLFFVLLFFEQISMSTI
jgi:hypothetical protein